MINVVVEGASDRGLASAVVRASGREVVTLHVKKGRTRLDRDLPNYNRAARWEPWVVFRDSDTRCPVELRGRLLDRVGRPNPGLLLRIVHPMSEAWLLADREGIAEYFSLSVSKVPSEPETLQDPKQTLLELARHSRSRTIREDVVIDDGAGGVRTGPLYVARLNEFAQQHWSAERAARRSDSLRRAIERIRSLAA